MPWGTGYTSDNLDTLKLVHNLKVSLGFSDFDYTKVINQDLMHTIDKLKLLDYADKCGLTSDCCFPVFEATSKSLSLPEFIYDPSHPLSHKTKPTLEDWKALLVVANSKANQAELAVETLSVSEYTTYKNNGGLDAEVYRSVERYAANKIDTLENFKFRRK
jgi:hypothetical protein